MAKRTDERRDRIVARAAEAGLASVEDLAREFAVTPSTIRRDLAVLSARGRLARTYGGAMPPALQQETSLREREQEGFDAKTAIAGWAAAQVRAGEHLLLDAGSTVSMLARRLPDADLTVTTASLPVLTMLRSRPDTTLVALGGRLRLLSDAFVGPLTEAALERITADRAFLGTDGVSTDGGLCEAVPEQTRLKELIAARSRHVYVLAHSAKLGRAPFHSWARIEAPWTLVTDDDVDPAFVDAFRADGRSVAVVPVR